MATKCVLRLNDKEREMWVLNDEPLYLWWKRSRVGMRQFIRENRQAITEAITARHDGTTLVQHRTSGFY